MIKAIIKDPKHLYIELQEWVSFYPEVYFDFGPSVENNLRVYRNYAELANDDAYSGYAVTADFYLSTVARKYFEKAHKCLTSISKTPESLEFEIDAIMKHSYQGPIHTKTYLTQPKSTNEKMFWHAVIEDLFQKQSLSVH